MTNPDEKLKSQDALAYIKLEGEGLEEGIISAKTGAEILGVIDRVVHRSIVQKYPELLDVNFDVPVQVKKGSWMALIPSDVIGWVLTAAGASTTAYGVKAAQSLAENDFSEIGIKDAVKKGVGTLQSTIRIAKHLGGTRKKPHGVKFEDNNETLLIPNAQGEYIKVKRSEYDNYQNYPEKLLKDIAKAPSQNQKISVGLVDGGKLQVESIDYGDKSYFGEEQLAPTDNGFLFPEMKEGDQVELIGVVTRANSQPNSMGFQYQGHILTCIPRSGKVEQYKPQLFKKCILRGSVRRLLDASFKDTMARPRLIIDELVIIEEENEQTQLL